MTTWYCIRTATRQEHKVVDGLHDLRHEHRLDLDAYLPCETRWNRLTRIKTIKLVPIVPGYLFVRIEPQHLWRVNEVEGVHQILGWNVRLSSGQQDKLDAFVVELRDAQAAGLFDKTQTPAHKRLKMEKGEKVIVSGGQFSGMIGEIVERRGADRVKVLLTIFGRKGPAIIPTKDLETLEVVAAEAA